MKLFDVNLDYVHDRVTGEVKPIHAREWLNNISLDVDIYWIGQPKNKFVRKLSLIEHWIK